jgi:hypothetical protein
MASNVYSGYHEYTDLADELKYYLFYSYDLSISLEDLKGTKRE